MATHIVDVGLPYRPDSLRGFDYSRTYIRQIQSGTAVSITGLMVSPEQLLQQLIATQRQAIKYYTYFIFGSVAIGISLTVAIYLIPDVPDGDWQVGIPSGGFGIPIAWLIHEIINRKEKIRVLDSIKTYVVEMSNDAPSLNSDDRARVMDSIWNIVQKTAAG